MNKRISLQWNNLGKGLAPILNSIHPEKNEVVGVAHVVKGSSTKQKLQNSKGYTESLEFLSVVGLFIFKKKAVAKT